MKHPGKGQGISKHVILGCSTVCRVCNWEKLPFGRDLVEPKVSGQGVVGYKTVM